MDTYAQFTEEVPDSGESLLLYELMDPRKICEMGNTEMGFANRGGHMNAMVGPMWDSAEYDGRAEGMGEERGRDV